MSKSPRRQPRILKPGAQAKLRTLRKTGQAATEVEVRRLFNSKRILEKAAAGELTTKVLTSGHPASPLAGEPVCTFSQLLAYLDKDGNKIAEAHRYLRPDGTIGLSGLPDPKEILHEGVIHYIEAR